MAVKITIPVEFRDSAQSYKQIISQLQEQLKRVKPGTAIYDTIKQQITDAEKEIKKVDAKLDLGIISKSEMQSVSSFLTRVDALVRRASDSLKTVDISNLIDFSDVELFSGDQLKQVQKYRDEIEVLEEKIQQINSSKIKDVLGSQDKSKFTAKELDSGIVETYQSLTTELKGIEEQAATTTSTLDKLRLSTAQAQREIIAYKKANADSLGTKLTASRILGANKSESLQNIGKRLTNEFSSLESIWNNAGPDGGQVIAETILGHLGLKPDQIAKLVSSSYQDTIKRIQEDFGKASGDASRIFRGGDLKQAREDLQARDILQKSNTLSTMEKNYEASRQEVQELRKQRNTLRATVGTLHEKVGILTSEMSVVDDDGSEIDIFKKLEEVQRELNKAITEARKLRATTGADENKQGAAADSNIAGMISGEAAITAQQEANKFKENLKQAISHWLSAQMIITKVREGIHQAWTDIQGLDKAMTNIAVVTDMSVSDLWGKIDEYMSIAQEYGVTTQGVYEVSQLYYQQGLSTNEVMEATTETLKMARIAGMDYAEAADAMTVAIRAFKMEMSDAQVITDVYSKVAAVTASDSQELAIAMSKTASSAESVGSSFENTTAMLAVMIETTRESAQNLGSALKSIISRYGEMKTGLTVDSEGEAIDYNKVDTALQSVGISIKDAQGQFRDFDDVIFELSKKWDSLDKNTQRYIATIMAGNRQQSRFIALVDNWERLDEVSKAAYDSEDAGLLQYAKTLDSLETKLNALSTSFQQFYMNIVNGGFFKGVVDILTAMLNGLNKLGNWQSILNIANLIISVKTISSLILNSFSGPLSEIVAQIRGHAEESVNIWADAGRRAAKANADAFNTQQQSNPPGKINTRYTNAWGENAALGNKLTLAASATSLVTSAVGTAIAKENQKAGAIVSGIGNMASGASIGASFGPYGMAIGAIAGFIASIPATIKAWDVDEILKNKLEKAEQVLDEAVLNRATKKEEARNLATTLDNLKKLQAARYESEEAEKAFIDASKAAFEQFPQLAKSVDGAGNAIIDVLSDATNAEYLLIQARQQAVDAAEAAAGAELSTNVIKEEQAQNEYNKYTGTGYDYDNNPLEYVKNYIIGEINNLGLDDEEHLRIVADIDAAKDISDLINLFLTTVTSTGENPKYDYLTNLLKKYNPIFYAEGLVNLVNDGLSNAGYITDVEQEDYNTVVANQLTAKNNLDIATDAVEGSVSGLISTYIDQLLLTEEKAGNTLDWKKISKAEELFYSQITTNITDQLTDEAFEKDANGRTVLTVKGKKKIQESFDWIEKNYTDLFTILNDSYDLDSFNSIISSLATGAFTPESFAQELNKIFGTTWPAAIGQYVIDYTNTFTESLERLTNHFASTGITWDSIEDGVLSLQQIFNNIPLTYHDELGKYATELNDKLKAGVITEIEANDLAIQYRKLWSLITPENLGNNFSEAQRIIAQASADGSLFTIGGQADVQRTLEEAGITNINIANTIPVYAVNLTTEFALLHEKIATGLKSLHSSLEKIGDGLDFENATKLANKMGRDLTEVFTFEEGKWRLKDQNLDAIISTIEKEYSNYQATLEKQLKNDVRILNSSMSDLTSKEDINRYLELMSEDNLTIAKDWASARDLKYDSDHDLVEAYLNSQYANISEVYEAEKEWLINQAKSSLNISQISRKLSGGQAEQNKQKALDIIKANGYTGYSSEDAAAIVEYLGLDPNSIQEIFRSLGDGTFAINTSYLNDKLTNDVIAALNDALSENVDRYFELTEKSIKSGLTDSEKIELGQLKLPPNLANDYIAIFLDQGKTDIEKYITLIKGVIANNKGSWDDIEEQIQSYYTSIFDSIFTAKSGLDQDSRNALKNIQESEGLFNPETLAEVFTQFSREADSELLNLDLTTLFDYDKVSQSLILATSEEAKAILDKLPLELQKALRGAANQRIINEATRLEETSETVLKQVTSIFTDATNVTLKDLIETYEAINGEGTFANSNLLDDYQLAIVEAKAGNVDILREHLYKLVAMARAKGVDVSGLEIIIQDATFAIVQAIADNIRAAAEGSLSAAGLDSLSKELNINLSAYTQKTFDGYKVSTQGMIKLGTAMVQKYGATYDVAKEMFDLFVGESGIYKGYRDIVKAAEDLNDPTKKQTKELQAQKKLLTDMAKIAMFNPDDPLFNFMDQDPSKGLALTASSMVDSIDKVKEAFATLKEGENISATDFYNMMDFMYDKLGGWDNLVNALGISDAALAKLGINAKAGEDVYGRFVNAIVSQSKILGEVDADVLMGIGLSVENMAGGMSDSLKQVANDQIEQLKAMRQTLVAMKELEGLGDIEFGFGLTAKDGTALDVFNFDQYLDEFEPEIITEKVQSKIDEVNAIFQNKGINIDWSLIFGEDGFTINDPTELAAFKNIMQFASSFADETSQEVWTAMAQKFSQAGEEFSWQSLIEAIASAEDWGSFAAGLSAEVQTLINAEIGQIPGIEIDSFEGTTIKLAEGANASSFIEQIKSVYGRYGYGEDVLKIDAEGSEIKVAIVNAQVNAQIDASTASLRQDGLGLDWSYLMDSDTYQATATIDNLETVITVNRLGEVTYKTVSGKELDQNNVKEFLNNNGLNIDTLIEEGATANTATFNLTMSGAEEAGTTVTTINEDVKAIREALENPIKIEVDDQATVKLGEIEAAYIQLADTLAARPLIISTEGSTLSRTVTGKEGEQNKQQELPTLEQKISITWEGLDDWKQENLIQPVKVSYSNVGSWKRDNQTQNVTVNYTVGTVEKPNFGGTGDGNSETEQTDGSGGATGNVNLLKVGAAFARGTLMGELGPELYVQNGQYHIAGADGPEFVDLDPDAIVFNHLQTAGLLGKGHITSTGSPVISERRSVALATGNVTGPAMASGLDSAIEAIDRAIAIWQNILGSTTQDLLNSSGGHKGGGSGNTLKAVTEELEEWYNLTRQIRDLEADITKLQKERANIPKADGEAYLKNLREEQKLLREQMATQQALLDYQELQLQRQADHINQSRIWSQFLTVGEDGLLQYIEGNETNGGKGALQVLQELNQMSGEEQTAFLKQLGYSYTDNDGNKLEGSELVEKFYEEMQAQIDQYDALYDTVNDAESTLEELQTSINDINEQIKENQLELEESIYDIIVEAWEKQIEKMEEQADLIKEANDAYINGLNEALSTERQMYDDNQKVADREQLQRQLSLLRRSGGSASEIANLEEQLNDMLKEEYFSNQERMIEDIQKANDIQVQQLETQIRLQEEALEYQKENGVIWTQVYEVLSKSRDEILAFMQGNYPDFFSKSLLQQEQMLTEWAHKIGIYKEDQKYQNYVNHAQTNLWENGQAWNIGDMSKYQSTYNNLTDEEKNTIRDQFTSVYANARLDGKSHEEAAALAAAEVSKTLKRKKDAADAEDNTPPTTNPNPQNPGGNDDDDDDEDDGGGGSSYTYDTITLTCTAGNTGGSPKLSTYSAKPKQTVTVTPNANTSSGYAFDYLTYNGNKKTGTTITPTGQVKSIAVVVYYKKTSSSSNSSGGTQTNTSPYTVYDSDRTSYGTFSSFTTAATTAQSVADKTRGKAIIMDASGKTVGTYSPSSSGSSSSSSSSTKEGWHYQLNGPNGERIKDSTAYSSRSQAQSAGAAAAAKKGSGWKYSTKWYMHGGLVDYTGLAMVHGSKTKPESFLNAEQTAQIREGLETTSGKSSALEGIKDTLLKLNSSIQSLTNITNKTESNTYTIAPGAVVIQVEQLNDAYDVDTLSADIMNRMYAIGNKSTNRGVSRR